MRKNKVTITTVVFHTKDFNQGYLCSGLLGEATLITYQAQWYLTVEDQDSEGSISDGTMELCSCILVKTRKYVFG